MIRTFILVSLAASYLLATVVGCGKRSDPMPARSSPAATTIAAPVAKIWKDREAENVARALGHESDVYRWQNGIADGWVQFDSEPDGRKVPLDFGRKFFDEVKQEENGNSPATNRFSGMLIVSRVKVTDAVDDDFDWYDYKIVIGTTWKQLNDDGSSTMNIGPLVGRIKFLKNKASAIEQTVETPQITMASDHVGAFPMSRVSGNVLTFGKPSLAGSDYYVWLELQILDPNR